MLNVTAVSSKCIQLGQVSFRACD